MALSPRDKGEVRAIVDAAIADLTHRSGDGAELTKDEQLAVLQAHVYNLDLENRLLRLALHGQKERAAIEQIAAHVGITVDLSVTPEPKEQQ